MMLIRCPWCGWSFTLGREALTSAVAVALAAKDLHHIENCPRCRKVIEIQTSDMIRRLPPGTVFDLEGDDLPLISEDGMLATLEEDDPPLISEDGALPMEPITLDIEGVQVTLKSVRRNKVYKCSCGFSHNNICDMKRKVSLTPSKFQLTATEVILNARNKSNIGWPIQTGSWELIDTDGYAYAASTLCNELQPPRMTVGWNVRPGTQADFLLVFPELEGDKEIARILYVPSGLSFHAFELHKMKPEAAELLQMREEAAKAAALNSNWQLRAISSTLDRLELTIHSRLYDVLIPKEATRLENDIRRLSLQVEQQLRALSDNQRTLFENKYREMLKSYEARIENTKAQEGKSKELEQKVEQLYRLSPREFEEYVAELFKALGYEKVTLTPTTNDKGVDILAEHQGIRVAIQCKKYKGVVGSPDIQTFLGAMTHAGAQRGFLVTTSVFSIEAENMASDHPIELIDGSALGKLIQQALKKN